MSYTIVGLFPKQEQAGAVSNELELAGIKNSDYIVYKTSAATGETKPTIWQKLFGSRNPEFISTDVDKLITSVEIHDTEEMNVVKNVFQNNEVVQIYEFQDMTIDEAKDLNYIKKIVEIRAKSQIFNLPEQKSHTSKEGMNAEVKV